MYRKTKLAVAGLATVLAATLGVAAPAEAGGIHQQGQEVLCC